MTLAEAVEQAERFQRLRHFWPPTIVHAVEIHETWAVAIRAIGNYHLHLISIEAANTFYALLSEHPTNSD
jgi:hypothetical protein